MPRATICLLLTLAGLTTCAVLRPSLQPSRRITGVAPWRFWQQKLATEPASALVVAGDSRVYRGIVPEAMEPILGRPVTNFGFSGVGFEPRYLDRLEALSADGGAILLSLTPTSLSRRACADNGFLTRSDEGSCPGGLAACFAPIAERLHPLTPRETLETLGLSTPPSVYLEDYRPSGWVASDQIPRDASRASAAYVAYLESDPAAPEVVAPLLARVARWRASGREVYAVRLPIGPELREIERRLGRVAWASLAEGLRDAGAVWLGDLSADERYETYDGSHLHAGAARELSRRLARAVADPAAAR